MINHLLIENYKQRINLSIFCTAKFRKKRIGLPSNYLFNDKSSPALLVLGGACVFFLTPQTNVCENKQVVSY